MQPERVRPSTDLLRVLLERDLIEWADDESLRLVWADLPCRSKARRSASWSS
ncbi:MAG: hypothetical protein HC927_09035, partial [Deltaproteobacteria bacterium]|nr:hypothetical protein [Deltaproteobacteria bacterium]